MAGLDAEGYLRLAGDRWLQEGGSFDRPPWNPVLAATGAALVAAGAMTLQAAQAVIAEYQAPAPGEDHSHPATGQTDRPAAWVPPDIGPFRVVPCGRVIDQSWGRLTVHYVTFTGDATTLRVTVIPGQAHGDLCGPRLPPGPRQLRVSAEHGTAVTGEFFGSARHHDPAWHGEYEARPALAADTPWIELLGERIELTGKPAGVRAWTESLPAQDPAARHLWERVATINDFHDPHRALDTTIAALVAAAALPADDPVTGQARAVLAVLWPRGTDRIARPESLAEPWQSLLARWGQIGGPAGIVTVGAVTPPFDGVSAAVIALQSDDEHFVINVELVPEVRTGLPYRDLPAQQHLTWWAVDDLGNHYLGEQGSWFPREGRGRGNIGFRPTLHPLASSIDLMPTATTQRAVIRVPLPWG